MWVRIITTITALLCLIAFAAELTLDSSTSFVRVNSASQVGKLVLVKVDDKQKQSSSQLPVAPDSDSSHGDSTDLSNLSVISHACQLAVPAALYAPILPVSKLTLMTLPPYQEPRLPNLQRPPSA